MDFVLLYIFCYIDVLKRWMNVELNFNKKKSVEPGWWNFVLNSIEYKACLIIWTYIGRGCTFFFLGKYFFLGKPWAVPQTPVANPANSRPLVIYSRVGLASFANGHISFLISHMCTPTIFFPSVSYMVGEMLESNDIRRSSLHRLFSYFIPSFYTNLQITSFFSSFLY